MLQKISLIEAFSIRNGIRCKVSTDRLSNEVGRFLETKGVARVDKHACSSGKIPLDCRVRYRLHRGMGVSIPFKREGSFRQDYDDPSAGINWREFQSPSNGKDHSDEGTSKSLNQARWFQVPTNGKDHSDAQKKGKYEEEIESFNSLQTGRIIQTET